MTSALTCFTWTPLSTRIKITIFCIQTRAETSPHSGRLPNQVDCGIL